MILCHAWRGRDPFVEENSKLIASWGYAAVAIDMYGKGVLGKTKEECAALKKPFMEDRELLQKRALKGFETASSLPYVDPNRIAVLGFGFGGTCALDIGRSGANLKGTISVYGHLASSHLPKKAIRGKVFVLHGYKDPIVTMNEFGIFGKEMDEAKVDWQAHIFGRAKHAFATPSANDDESGIIYDPDSAKAAWELIRNFLTLVF